MFGLGWKAPLAYTSSFTFIARKNGIERKYIMSEGEEENIIDLIDEESTTADNGVKIIIPVNYYDVNTFYNKIREQLCYFESIYFNVNYSGKTINNDFKITRYEDFQMSELTNDTSLHLCLDNVYYPIDFKKLGIAPISIPVALRFGLSDGIYPTPNREAIRYTTETKATIMKKIKTVASKLVEMYNKLVEGTDDFQKIVTYYSNSGRYVDIGHESNINIENIIPYSNIKIKKPLLKGISLLNLEKLVEHKDEIFSDYSIKYTLRHGRVRENKRVEIMSFYNVVNSTIYKFADRLGGNKKEYIKSISNDGIYFVKNRESRKLFPSENTSGNWYDKNSLCYYTLLNLAKHPRKEWRERIKEFQIVKASLEKKFKDADALEIPKAWLDARKKTYVGRKKNGHQKLEGEISCKKAEPLERYVYGKDCKFTPFSIDLGKLQQTNVFYVYTSHENSNNLDKLFKLSTKQNCKFITFSERELKRVGELSIHNLISYEKFMKGETKHFRRIVTAKIISDLMAKYGAVFSKYEDVAEISIYLSEKLIKLSKYRNENYHSGSDSIYSAMIEVATANSLFDNSVYQDYLYVKSILEEFPFIDAIYKTMSSDLFTETRVRILVDLMKYNKCKINFNHYKKKTEVINN